MFEIAQQKLIDLAYTIPLEYFVLIASFVEEIIAPIPSFTVMLLTGTLAGLQGHTVMFLLLLAVLGSIGKVLGALIIYHIADVAEDWFFERRKNFFGISHKDIEAFGSRLTHSVRDYAILIFLRAAPFVPSVLLSAGAGVLKIPRTIFVVTTFIGTIVRDMIYLYAGYAGIALLDSLIEKSVVFESYVLYGAVVFVAFLMLWYYRRSRSG